MCGSSMKTIAVRSAWVRTEGVARPWRRAMWSCAALLVPRRRRAARLARRFRGRGP